MKGIKSVYQVELHDVNILLAVKNDAGLGWDDYLQEERVSRLLQSKLDLKSATILLRIPGDSLFGGV